MKQILIATTALVCSAGIAAAEVKISGYGRTGIDYQEDRTIINADGEEEDANSTQIISRLRMHIDASKTTDSNVDFGARFRIQWDQNAGDRGENAVLNAGQIWVRSQGLTVAVGNVGSAFDDAELLQDAEIGIYDRGYGDPSGAFFAYETSPYDNANRLGISAEYEFGPVATKFSYIDPDQTGARSTEDDDLGQKEEYALSVYYEADRFSVSAAAVKNGAGVDGNDIFGIGGAYKLRDTIQVGLNWIDNGDDRFYDINDIDGDGDFDEILEESAGDTVVLYGTFDVAPLTSIEAYVAHNDAEFNDTKTAFGIGANYDLGGGRLSGAIERGYDENIRADAGVRFDF